MIQVRLLTDSQKKALQGKEYKPNCYFNPIQDANDNWIISNDEVVQCINPTVVWVNELPLIDYEPKPEPEIF
jgi:hypothetical protein